MPNSKGVSIQLLKGEMIKREKIVQFTVKGKYLYLMF